MATYEISDEHKAVLIDLLDNEIAKVHRSRDVLTKRYVLPNVLAIRRSLKPCVENQGVK